MSLQHPADIITLGAHCIFAVCAVKPQPHLPSVVTVQPGFLTVPSGARRLSAPSFDAPEIPVLLRRELPHPVGVAANLHEHVPVVFEFLLPGVNELIENLDVHEAILIDLHN